MIITRLIGGLGNQMFQYALARHLAELHQTELKLDLSEFEEYKLHDFSLQHFNIVEDYASKEDLDRVSFVKEKHFHFDGDFRQIADDVLIKGYWQSEKYFVDIENLIRAEFTVKSALAGKDLEVAERIGDSNSVSLHIRRSDYVPNTYKDQIFDSLGLEYYRQAIGELSRMEEDLHLFVFSDDPVWVRSNVDFGLPIEYVDHNNAATNYQDMRLMSLCRHNIIANSSFSWWGAWLNDNRGKQVFAPAQWFNSNVRNLDPKDIIPAVWIKI